MSPSFRLFPLFLSSLMLLLSHSAAFAVSSLINNQSINFPKKRNIFLCSLCLHPDESSFFLFSAQHQFYVLQEVPSNYTVHLQHSQLKQAVKHEHVGMPSTQVSAQEFNNSFWGNKYIQKIVNKTKIKQKNGLSMQNQVKASVIQAAYPNGVDLLP